ncbi:3-oxoacyl-ACP reductase [Flavobacterium suaedae]|uniref:3-oxoacyl-ACP reductase n=1 Tax=Flavobacterium suaedae TaxID=1767027 RepID=A0ABQ1JLK3_9FLAO|nr:SDR family oxidoreductase [Flavobacterium suaedae]GGB72130.1 3-oxoacyl-ACP reductase [Flavobacterium suaedae]
MSRNNEELSPFSLEGKLIAITGASSGIGKQIAITCSNLGASLVLFGRNRERLNQTVGELQNPDKHIVFETDINDFEKVKNDVKEAVSIKGKFSGLVNCAGVSPTMPLRATSETKMQEVFKTNVVAAMNLTKLICKPANLNKEGGSIVFIASVMGSVGEIGKSLYGMSKGALIAGTKSLAVEYGAKNIRFNSISPGVVVTPMSMSSEYSKDEKKLQFVTDLHPLGLGKPEDIANGTAFLLSDASRWVTGTDLIIDGGYTAK